MKKLFIIGAGGFGREVLGYALDIADSGIGVNWEIAGFLDDDLKALANYELEYNVVGTIKNHVVCKDNVYFCAIGNPKIKLDIGNKFLNQGAEFINLIHPLARIGRTCRLGVGDILCPGAVLTENVQLENFVAINCQANCGHDAVLEDGCTLSVFCDVTGFVHLGKSVFMGSHASIIPGIKIGNDVTIGAGAVVVKDIPSNCTAVGVPAKVIE